MVKRLRNLVGIILASSLICASAWGAGEQSIQALRGAYLYYFSHFIEWPKNTAFLEGAFDLCALSDDSGDRYQLYTINGKNVGDAKLRITLLDVREEVEFKKCHMLFVADSHSKWLAKHAERLASQTLLVTEGSLKQRGLVHLFIENQKLKFTIDQKKMKARGFKASSKLLRLSRRSSGGG